MLAASELGRDRFLVVVADESTAVLYGRETRRAPLREIERLENDDARKKSADLESDRGGRSFDSFGAGRHAMSNELHGVKTHSAEVFARRVAMRIEGARETGDVIDYSVIAAPRFLGMLRQALTRTSCPAPGITIDKEVTGRDPQFIARLIERG